MSDIQKRAQEAIDRLVESGAERGLQVAVYRHGEPVVDAVAGVADPATGRPVGSDTVFYTYSVGKAMASTLVHIVVERGMFGYDTTIAKLWPEFGAHGKETVTVRHVLTHTAGVPGVPADTTPEDLCDWDKMCSVIADTKPWWEPGTKVAYHAYPFGYIVGELVRRATGKPISQLLREGVAGRGGRRPTALARTATRSHHSRYLRQRRAPRDPGHVDTGLLHRGARSSHGDRSDPVRSRRCGRQLRIWRHRAWDRVRTGQEPARRGLRDRRPDRRDRHEGRRRELASSRHYCRFERRDHEHYVTRRVSRVPGGA